MWTVITHDITGGRAVVPSASVPMWEGRGWVAGATSDDQTELEAIEAPQVLEEAEPPTPAATARQTRRSTRHG